MSDPTIEDLKPGIWQFVAKHTSPRVAIRIAATLVALALTALVLVSPALLFLSAVATAGKAFWYTAVDSYEDSVEIANGIVAAWKR